MRVHILVFLTFAVMTGPVEAQLLPQLPLGGAQQQQPPPSSGSGGSYPDDAGPLQAWISADALEQSSRWRRVDRDEPLPWIAPDTRVEAYLHSGRYDEYGRRDEVRWKIGERLAYPVYAYDYWISDFLLRTPVSKDWPRTDERMRRPGESWRRDLLVCPYRLQLVSVEPTVVVMVPDAKASEQSDSGSARRNLTSVYSAIDHDAIRYSTRFPARDGLLWFSPDAKVPPSTLTLDAGGNARFTAGPARIECVRRDDTIDCKRGS
jgi:hypothetical protein